jgi:2-aminoethylphosphonate-pyruvate transaminase
MQSTNQFRFTPPTHSIIAFKHKNFIFEEFYKRLSDKGKIIYPGKMTKAMCFRIGNIGNLYPKDMHDLVDSIKSVLNEMKIKTPIESSG